MHEREGGRERARDGAGDGGERDEASRLIISVFEISNCIINDM